MADLPGAPPFLGGVRVLELGGGIAGSTAAAILAGLGADVVKAPPSGDRDLRAGPQISTPNGSFAAVDLTLDRNKRQAAAGADIASLAAEYDIVIIDGDATDLQARDDGPVLVTVTPFGLDGPRAAHPGGELVAQAASGLLATIEGSDGSPVAAPGYVASKAAGAVTALAALHGLDLRRSQSGSVQADVSVQEAVIFTAALPECAHVLFSCPGRAGSGRYLAPSGVFECRDGLVRITAVENHQWQGLLRALDHPTWAQGLDERESRIDNATMINEHVTAWAATQDKAACSALLQANGVPSTPVNTPAELLSSPQYIHRGSLAKAQSGGHSITVIGNPWVAESGGTARSPRSGRLADLRVTELTHVLAGPIIGALLGAMGAQVVRIEDPDRLDIYRRTGPFAAGKAGVERGAYFAVANHSKDSVLIDPARAAEHVGSMLDDSDVMIENVGGSRLDRLGVAPDRLAEAGKLAVRVSGFGSSGPLAGYRVYANNVQSYGGLAGLTTDAEGTPAKFGTVIADPLSSVVAAIVIAAWAVGTARDTGAVIDLSMAEVVTSTIDEFVSAASIEDSSSSPDSALHRGVYRSADRRWVALEVLGAAEWARVADLLGEECTPCPDAIAATVAAADADAIAERFADAGLRAAVAVRADDLIRDLHLTARDFFPEIAHPDPEIGTARLVGMPWRFVGQGPIPLRPPPALGNANARYERTMNA